MLSTNVITMFYWILLDFNI